MSNALDLIYDWSVFPDQYHNYAHRKSNCGPGQFILSRNENIRTELQNLKSSDFANLRLDAIFPLSKDEAHNMSEKRRNSELMIKFDRRYLNK